MPIYEYQCEKCGRVLEAYQKFSEPGLKTCKNCSGRLHKLVSQSSFHLKGTGWYVTDYGNKRTENTSPSNKKSTDKPASEKTDKTKSKPTSSKKEA